MFSSISFSTTAQNDKTCFTSEELVRIADEIMEGAQCREEIVKVRALYMDAEKRFKTSEELRKRSEISHSRLKFELEQKITGLEKKVVRENKKGKWKLIIGFGVGAAVGIAVSK